MAIQTGSKALAAEEAKNTLQTVLVWKLLLLMNAWLSFIKTQP